VSGETTSFDYWPTGLLKKVTLPDASYLQYTYDGAHRLTQITDALGNKVTYTLDAMGNRTVESAYDPSSVLHRTHSRVINALDQVYQEINAAGTAAVTTTFGYDNNGNQTAVNAPLSRNTANQYDELNRLNQIVDPGSGVTQFGYDANDNPTSITDPRGLVTSYTYSGFGDLIQQASPDTGTTANTYDSAGNLATSTDARGAVSTYAYDALNRVTSVAYSLGGTTDQTIAFTYDAVT
jgi:YD repeat-containing protein